MSKLPIDKKIRNIFSISVGQIMILGLNLVSIALAARYLNVHDFGEFSYLLVLVGIAAKLFDFGFNPIIFRETSRTNDYNRFLGIAFIFRIIFLFCIIIGFNLFAFINQLKSIEILLVNLLLFNILLSNKFTNFRDLLSIPFKTNLLMHFPMIFAIIDNFVLLVLVLLMPILKVGLTYFVIVYVISNIPGFLLLIFFLNKQFEVAYRFSYEDFKWLFKEALPLAGFVLFAFLYLQVDILLLKYFVGMESVGYYSAALRLVQPLTFIPSAIVMTFFPIIVRNIENKISNQQIINLIYKILFLMTVSFALGVMFKSDDLITFVFGAKYKIAGYPVLILFWSLVFSFFNFFSLDLLTAYKKQKFNFIYVLVITFVVIILDLLLIPSYGIDGASIGRLISGAVGSLFLFAMLKKQEIKMSFLKINTFVYFILLGTVAYIFENLYLLLFIIIMMFASIAFLFLLRVFSELELKQIFKLFNKEKWVKYLTFNG